MLKVIIHVKMKILSTITEPQDVSGMYEFFIFYSVEHKR